MLLLVLFASTLEQEVSIKLKISKTNRGGNENGWLVSLSKYYINSKDDSNFLCMCCLLFDSLINYPVFFPNLTRLFHSARQGPEPII